MPTELVSVTLTDPIALAGPLMVNGMLSEKAPPYWKLLAVENHVGSSLLTSAVKLLVPDICDPEAAANVKVAVFKSRVVEVATTSTLKPVEVTSTI